MPSTSDSREFGISADLAPRRSTLAVSFTATFTTASLPVQCRFVDLAPGKPFEDSRHELRVSEQIGTLGTVLVIGVQLHGESTGEGFTITADKRSKIVPPAVDDDPSFPRRIDHAVTRTWTQTAEAGIEVVKHRVVLELACDANGDYDVEQRVAVQTAELIEIGYALTTRGVSVGTGSVRMTTRASAEGGLVLLPPAFDDKIT
jgi:hypothetical protein